MGLLRWYWRWMERRALKNVLLLERGMFMSEEERKYYENVIKTLREIRKDIKELVERVDENERNVKE